MCQIKEIGLQSQRTQLFPLLFISISFKELSTSLRCEMQPVEPLETTLTSEGKVTECKTREEYGSIGVEEETNARRCSRMLIDRYSKEDIFARVPQMTQRIDPVLQQLDPLLDDDEVYQQVRSDFGKRYRQTLMHGRHSTPVEVLLRMLLLKHLFGWSYQETEDRVDESLVYGLPTSSPRCSCHIVV